MTVSVPELQELLRGRYAIRHELGGGAMAVVFAADDLRHGRPVAIKLLRPEYAATIAAERFDQEVQIAARLQHPHIVPLLDSGEAGGAIYLVMPLVEGESLRTRLVREGPLPVRDVIRILADVADALAYAHRKGIVHRDIKPDNILLAGRHALVADFGVAKALSEAMCARRDLTGGVALGTPAYMAPEQATADPGLDHRVDLYAFGILGYELLTGRPPFEGDTPHALLTAQVLQAPVPVSELRPDTPPALAALVMRALEKQPAERWASAEELLPQLDGLATPSGGVTPLPLRAGAGRPSLGRWLALVAAAVVLLAAGARILLPRSAHPPEVSQTQLTYEGDVGVAALAPGGDLLAYVANRPEVDQLKVQDLRGGEPIILASERSIAAPTWSPDGAEVRFEAIDSAGNISIRSVPRLGGPARVIALGAAVAVGPEGSARIRMPRGRKVIAVIDPATGDSTNYDLAGILWHSDPILRPGGGMVAFATSDPATHHYRVMLFDPRDPTPRAVVEDSTALGTPAWSPDGRALYYLRTVSQLSDLMRQELSAGGSPRGAPQRVASGLAVEVAVTPQLSVAGEGRRILYIRQDAWSNLSLVRLRGSRVMPVERPLTMGSAYYRTARLSPDGRTIALVRTQSQGMSLELQPVAGGPSRVLGQRPSLLEVAWSPDGTRLAASEADWKGKVGIEVFSAGEGSQRLYGALRPGVSLTWQDDSTVLMTREGNRGLVRLPLSGADPRDVLPGLDSAGWVFHPIFSPVAGTVAMYLNHGGADQGMTLLDLATGTTRDLMRMAALPLRWAPDGTHFFAATTGLSADSTLLLDIHPARGTVDTLATFSRAVEILDFDPSTATLLLNIRNQQSDAWAIDLAQPGRR